MSVHTYESCVDSMHYTQKLTHDTHAHTDTHIRTDRQTDRQTDRHTHTHREKRVCHSLLTLNNKQVLPRFELGSLDSKSRVLIITP